MLLTGKLMKNRRPSQKHKPLPKPIHLPLISAILLALSTASLHAQTVPQQSPTAAAEQAPGISTSTNEVALDLVVHDKKHNAVADLKPEDLAVTDNGVPVKLTGFRLVSGDSAAARGHLITLLFDPFHGAIAKSTRILADKILAGLPQTGYSFAVLDFKGRLRLLQDFTQDRAAVEAAVNVETESKPMVLTTELSMAFTIMDDKAADEGRAKAAAQAEKDLIAIAQTGADASGHHVDVHERSQAQTLFAALNDAQAILQEQHARLSLAGLLALVKSQQAIPDRKAIIYFTQNQQLDLASKKLLATITAAAARAGVLIYTVDMETISNGSKTDEANALLNGPAITGVQQAATPIAGPVVSGAHGSNEGPVWGVQQDIQVMTDFMRSSGEDRTDPFADMKSPMADFSKATGGAYIDGQNSTKKPLERMVQDLSTYYQASYVPPNMEYDGKFHAIAVKPLRAGLNIQTKSGYFALAPGASGGTQPFEAPLLKAIAQPHLPADIKFRAAVLRFGDLPDGNTSTLAVEVPLSQLTTHIDTHTNLSAAHLAIVAQIKDQSGVVIEHYAEDITKRGVAESLNRDSTSAISFERHFISLPGAYTMEVAVQDLNSTKTGAQRADFEIPNQPAATSLSDIVVVRTMAGSHEEEDDPLEPLRYEHQKVTPNLSGDLPADEKDLSLFFILHPDPDSTDPMKLEMELIHNGKPGKRTPLLQSSGARAAVPYLASIKSRALPPGSYEVKAYLSQGAKSSQHSQTFRVAGTGPATPTNADVSWFEGADLDMGAGNGETEPVPHPANELAITPPAKPAPAPPVDQARLLIERARKRALSYNDFLPNFVCTELTQRSIDPRGDGRWKRQDSLLELLSYRNHVETRTTLEVNGRTSDMDRQALKGTFSAGEFGGVLQAVFRDASKADFQWLETDSLNGAAVQVYNYRVDAANSTFSVTGSNGKQLVVGFHGQVFIDADSSHTRRVTLIADSLPPDFPTQATSMAVDYEFVAINGLKYLMPASAKLQLKQLHHEALINTMEFSDYKRFDPNAAADRN
jgi:VWFA-related protein